MQIRTVAEISTAPDVRGQTAKQRGTSGAKAALSSFYKRTSMDDLVIRRKDQKRTSALGGWRSPPLARRFIPCCFEGAGGQHRRVAKLIG